MRRLLVIAAAVLVPFGLLVWWGLASLSHEPVALPPPALFAVEPVPVAEEPSAAPLPAPAPLAAPAVVAPAPVEEPAAAAPADESRVKAAVIEQLTPVVTPCFVEMDGRLKQKVRVVALFETQPDGSLSNVRLKMKSADPYLTACMQDALEGAHLDPARGLPGGPFRHTFTFNPGGAK